MTERIDHAAEARNIVEIFHAPSPEGAQMIAEAQVHAMLALVEQQRIANLISYERARVHFAGFRGLDAKLEPELGIREALGPS